MRLGLDARLLGPEQKGLGRYVEQTLLSAAALPNVSLVIFCLPARVEYIKHLAPNAEVVPMNARWYTIREQILFPLLLRKHRVDVMHYPHFNVPIFSRVPFIVTIHDLLLLEHPTSRASFLGPLRFYAKYYTWQVVLRAALRRARLIITPTNYVALRIQQQYPWVSTQRLITVPLGADACNNVASLDILSRRGIAGDFFLYVGNVYPHKNIAWLITVFQTYHFRHPESQLVLVGASDPFHTALKKKVLALGLADAVVWWGMASDAELGRLYQACTAYVFPTLSEGFGIPPLEAMRSGAPVICTDLPVLREVLGNAARYFSLNDTSGILTLMERVACDPVFVHTCRVQGIERAKQFTWEQMHTKTRAIYEIYRRTHSPTRETLEPSP
ncbi:MAG: glycosyltransferase family 1 protein [bacterium]|nr:glycosyltransferase family 1 protein [bacterium]